MTLLLDRKPSVETLSTALLIIDFQYYAARRDGGHFKRMSDTGIESRYCDRRRRTTDEIPGEPTRNAAPG